MPTDSGVAAVSFDDVSLGARRCATSVTGRRVKQTPAIIDLQIDVSRKDAKDRKDAK
jgi:hypothetical protein